MAEAEIETILGVVEGLPPKIRENLGKKEYGPVYVLIDGAGRFMDGAQPAGEGNFTERWNGKNTISLMGFSYEIKEGKQVVKGYTRKIIAHEFAHMWEGGRLGFIEDFGLDINGDYEDKFADLVARWVMGEEVGAKETKWIKENLYYGEGLSFESVSSLENLSPEKLMIPKLGIEEPVLIDVLEPGESEWDVPSWGIATPEPGRFSFFEKAIWMFGHSMFNGGEGVFYKLPHLKKGDKVFIDAKDLNGVELGELGYEVRRVVLLYRSAAGEMIFSNKPEGSTLILQTSAEPIMSSVLANPDIEDLRDNGDTDKYPLFLVVGEVLRQ